MSDDTKSRAGAETSGSWRAAETHRRAEVRKMFKPFRNRGEAFTTIENCVLDDMNITVEMARDWVLELAASQGPTRSYDLGGGPAHFQPGRDRIENFRDAATEALLYRAGSLRGEERIASARQNEYLSSSPTALASPANLFQRIFVIRTPETQKDPTCTSGSRAWRRLYRPRLVPLNATVRRRGTTSVGPDHTN